MYVSVWLGGVYWSGWNDLPSALKARSPRSQGAYPSRDL